MPTLRLIEALYLISFLVSLELTPVDSTNSGLTKFTFLTLRIRVRRALPTLPVEHLRKSYNQDNLLIFSKNRQKTLKNLVSAS